MSGNQPPPPPSPNPSSARFSFALKTESDWSLIRLLSIEAVLVSGWIIAVGSFQGSGGAIAYAVVTTFCLVYLLHLVVIGMALWLRFKRQASVRLTTVVVAAPWVALPIPFWLNRLNPTGAFFDTPEKVINVTIALTLLPVIAAVVRPRIVGRLIPARLLQSVGFNLLVLISALSLYLLPIGFLAMNWTEVGSVFASPTDGYLLAYGLGALTTYVMAASLPAFSIVLYSALGLAQKEITAHRKLRLAQGVAALPLTLIGLGMLAKIWFGTT